MAERGGQPGNKCAAKGAEWRQAIRKALARHANANGEKASFRKGLGMVADKFIEAAANGDPWAMKELGDRVDGKPTQGVEISGKDGGPIQAIDWTIQPVIPVDKTDETNTEG